MAHVVGNQKFDNEINLWIISKGSRKSGVYWLKYSVRYDADAATQGELLGRRLTEDFLSNKQL